ncbi:TetR/AcrR family transcriptional regulator [Tenggerimyces flavus]|uniref:TetR/AcrR family transcriptional regulator n=1 Tax=Tenggerimyces flavus TaxID=1708749 RepID=A0ABV7YIZ1_9ACTN|nr:TetR/AcrR family transcriptional regulator [Tenggerimyces flavus]
MRSAIIEAAARLLAESPTGDISTRAVGEAAGVQQPVLYRHFGDKDALLAAVVDHGFERYLESKRGATSSGDPVADLRAGWDNHAEFALAHPSSYRLMFSPTLRKTPEAAYEMHRLLLGILHRIAEQGRLKVPPETAAQLVMSANTGVSLSLITRPELYPDRSISRTVRDAVFATVLTDHVEPASKENAQAAAATTLLASKLDKFTPAEAGLLKEWLERLTTTSKP